LTDAKVPPGAAAEALAVACVVALADGALDRAPDGAPVAPAPAVGRGADRSPVRDQGRQRRRPIESAASTTTIPTTARPPRCVVILRRRGCHISAASVREPLAAARGRTSAYVDRRPPSTRRAPAQIDALSARKFALS